MYSADPASPAARINELKTLVNEIHKQGMGVILDVVYNHTANNNVLGNALIPGYYYRSSSANGSAASFAEGLSADAAETTRATGYPAGNTPPRPEVTRRSPSLMSAFPGR